MPQIEFMLIELLLARSVDLRSGVLPGSEASSFLDRPNQFRAPQKGREKDHTGDLVGILRGIEKRTETAHRNTEQPDLSISGRPGRRDDVLMESRHQIAFPVISEMRIDGDDIEIARHVRIDESRFREIFHPIAHPR
jgi:hypothetical protein